MEPYLHRVQFYETDKMGVVHHANYLHWFEEARLCYLDRIGASYTSLEARGYESPVVSVRLEYKSPVKFGETVAVRTWVSEMKAVRYRFSYTVTDACTGALRAAGESEHCFLDKSGRLIAFRRDDREIYEIFLKAFNEAQE